MSKTKAFWRSRGFWGPVIALVSLVFDMREWGEVDQAAVLGAIDQLFLWGGVLLGAWGRIVAKERLGMRDEA